MGSQTQYEIIIGMEVHAQLNTASKIFCGCPTQFGAEPNTQTCPVCLGMPGVLPVLNRKVVEMGISLGLATGCRIAPRSRFARKNYFYPDLPKGYQISQYELPLCEKGHIEITTNGQSKRIGLTRIHMEEDAGKNLHEGHHAKSQVDLNRAGVPLLEIVSEPEIFSAEEAVAYLKTLRDILMYLEVCDGNMERGNFRCEPNISLRPVGEATFGKRVEVKNINSFRFVQKAIEYEVDRQETVLREGAEVIQETRLWNSNEGITLSMRSKEEAHDYRYFPEPDLVPLEVSSQWVDSIRDRLPELAHEKRQRFSTEFALPAYDAEVLTTSRMVADFFEQSVKLYEPVTAKRAKIVSNWMMTELLREIKSEDRDQTELPLSPKHFVGLLQLIDEGVINSKMAKELFPEMYRSGKAAAELVAEKGLSQVSDEGALASMILEVMKSHPAEVQAYQSGKDKLLGFFVGQIMKASKGKGNPGKVNELLKKMLMEYHAS